MILRKDFLLFSAALLAISSVRCQEADSKTYDENDWIPIAPKRAQSQPVIDVEKKATGRVLNLADPPANSFFPEETKPPKNNNFQQYLRETTTFQKRPVELTPQNLPVRVKQPPPHQHPYKFESSQAGRLQGRPPKPQKEFYIPQQTPQQAQFVQYYQPNDYHTIPEEFLNQRPQALPQQQYFSQNFEIPDLPPIRLNATSSRFEKRPKPVQPVEIPGKNEERDNVQLLYVPLETLAAQQVNNRPQQDHPRLHAYQQAPIADIPPQFINYRPVVPHKQQQLQNIQSDFAKQALEAHKLQLQFQQQPQPEQEYVLPVEVATEPSTTTKKPASKKRKAHQPPLAVYMGGSSSSDVNEVLALLKDASSIDVQDSIGPNSPKIFVGPSTLEAPRGYTKFELPYLSSLDSNRVERKIDQYPFFVAPLSYKAPAGYSKIPLPSPHVGSVVIKEKETRKPAIQQPQQIPQSQVQPQPQPEVYQQFSLQDQQQFEYQQRPTPVVSSTPRYSKPIPEEHVIKQHEIDQINSFIPQYNENLRLPETSHRFQETAQRGQHVQQEQDIQHVPEKYQLESFSRPQTTPTRHSTVRFSSTPQPQLTEDQFIDEILQQQHKPSSVPVRHEEYIRPSSVVSNQNEQYLHEVTRPQLSQVSQEYTQSQEDENQYSTGSTHGHSSTRSRTTPAPAVEQYQEEITKAPTRIRTRPTQSQTHVRESYDAPTRTTHSRSRPTTTPAPAVTEDQYLKETVIESRPKVRPTTEKPKYSIQEKFSIGRSTTPSPLHYTPVAPEYEEEVQPHRPIIYKYKQSEEIQPEYQQPVYHVSTPKPRINQHQLNQEALDSKVLTHETSGNFVTGPGQQIYQFQPEEYEEQHEQVKTQNANVENYNIGQSPQPHGQLPNLINNLEDQSVRQLLQPGLIPTSPKTGEVERYEVSSHDPISSTTQAPSSHYPSTHLPHVETTTPRKVVTRGRVRGSRFSTTTPSTPVSSTRRAPVTRGRRPLPSRTRYQDESEQTTENTLVRSTTDPTKKIVTARSRFRTRGRPVPETTDRVSSAYEQEVTPSHIQSNHVPSVQIIEPQVTQRVSAEYINYRPVYNVPADQELVLINNRKVTKPATEPVVIHQINQLPIKNLEEENTENTSSRNRGRRPTTTAIPQVETSRKYETDSNKDSSSDEFYGFFRDPSFKKPAEVSSTPTPTEASRPLYSSTYVSSTLKPHLREEDVQPQVRYHSSTENVQFVGEIRPKYQTTAQYFEASQPSISTERFYQTTQKEAVEEEKPRVRPRVRLPIRTRVTPAPASEDNRRGNTNNDETKSVTQRGRTRGKTHYRMPQKPKRPASESSEDEDVEGGNYPAQFKNFHTTARPSFQITVDPQDDQEGFQSIYRPTYVAKDNSKDDGVKDGHLVENYQMPNFIPSEVKGSEDIPLALPSIATAPEVNHVIQEEQQKMRTNIEVDRIVEEMNNEYDDYNNPDQTEKSSPTIIAVEEDFDESVTTVIPETTTQKRRRGVWKLVRRPTDVLEGAESQNAASNKNLFSSEEKEQPAKIQPIQVEYTTLPMTTLPENEVTTPTPVTTTTEGGFFDSLYNMFGIPEEKTKIQVEEDVDEVDTTTVGKTIVPESTFAPETSEPETQPPPTTPTTTTTTTTTERPVPEVETTTPLTSMTYITPMSLETWNKGILKTSTSTEISHETEICYKGKCIKSKDMKVPL